LFAEKGAVRRTIFANRSERRAFGMEGERFRGRDLPAALAHHRAWTYAACGAVLLCAVAASVLAAPGVAGVLGGGLAAVMLAIAVIDARHFIIPDWLVLVALGLGLLHAASAAPQDISAVLMFAAVRGLVLALAFWALLKGYEWVRRREGMGLGDVKLAFVAGVWLDWLALILAVEVAALAALAVVAIRALRGHRVTGQTPVPFGAFFAPAIWLGWVLEASVLPALL
jgi:leader peptidase (prepilin peptidase)/N-methyltransferase